MRSIERGAVLLGKYRVDSVIGRGGMGLVVRAWHLGLDEEVAIKMLRDDIAVADETIARFIREAQAAAKLKSEHIARIIDVGTFDDGKPFTVMEFLEGQDIGQLLAERGRLQPSLAIELVIQACEALAEAHSLGIIHRDIKPTNLFLTSRPDGSVLLKILDFGISKSPAGAELSLTQTWSLLGSPAYMSPEQMRSARHVDTRTDVWSLGAVLYEVLEGHLPFQADSFSEMCVMVAVDPPTPMIATPRELAAIIMRCLAKSPDERYRSVADLACDLACLAREPDKAQILVDRMYRMLRRGALRRTPAAGVPVAVPSEPSAQLRRSSLPQDAAPAGVAVGVAVGVPSTTPVVSRSQTLLGGVTGASHLQATSPPSGMPMTAARAGSPAGGVLVSGMSPALPPAWPALGSPASGMLVPNIPPAYPGYSYAVALPMPRNGDAPYVRPGRPGIERSRAGSPLTTTQVISPRNDGWIVALVTAVIALVAAIAVILVLRGNPAARPVPADDGPTIVKMTPVPAPAPAPAAGKVGSTSPASTAR